MEATNYYLEFNPATHEYFIDGERKPSVTQILNLCGLVDTQFFTEYGRWRGSATHKATHFYDEGDYDIRTCDKQVKPFLDGYIKFRKETGYTPTLIEKPLWDDMYDFCGTPDRRGYFKDMGGVAEESNDIIDLKCYPGGHAPWWVRFQMAGYGRLLDPKRLFRRWAVVLTGDGNYNLEEYDRESYISDVGDFLCFARTAQVKLKYIR
jgi:hypothetical protein